jgi:glycosyltransferase involved in cell wall biosynthesis
MTASSGAPSVLISGVCLGQPAGGVRRHNAQLLPRLAEQLEAKGGRLAVLEGRVPITFELPESVERIPSRVHWLPTALRAASESRVLAESIAQAQSEGRPFDLVHTAHLPTPKSLGIPFTLTIHDLRSLDLNRAPFVRRLIGGKVLSKATTDAARIFVVSEWMKSRVAAEFPHAAHKVQVVGNGVDHLPVHSRQPKPNDPYLLHVGHIEPRKNLDLVVRALASDPALPRLLLAGSPKGDTDVALKDLASELGVQDRLAFHVDPSDEAVAGHYAAAGCAVFPSRLEGHGIGPLEAARAGCPVAVSDIPAHRETLGAQATTFDVDDPDACARALRAVLEGARAPLAVPSFRTWDQCADAWAAGLTDALSPG